MARVLTPEAVLAACETRMGGPFAWWDADCCSGPCRVFDDLWGVNPMGAARYETGRQARRLIRAHGGMRGFTAHYALRAGLTRCGAELGAIGLIHNGAGLSLAICLGPTWAGKGQHGLIITGNWEGTAWRLS